MSQFATRTLNTRSYQFNSGTVFATENLSARSELFYLLEAKARPVMILAAVERNALLAALRVALSASRCGTVGRGRLQPCGKVMPPPTVSSAHSPG